MGEEIDPFQSEHTVLKLAVLCLTAHTHLA